MTTYKIKLVSQTNSIFLIAILLAIFFSVLSIPKGIPRGLLIILLILFGAISYFSWQKFVTGRTEWTIDDKGVGLTWIQQFAFNEKNNIYLEWKEIEKIYKGPDRNYYTLKIKSVTGKKLKFYHDNLTTKDDFEIFIRDLYQSYYDNKKLTPG